MSARTGKDLAVGKAVGALEAKTSEVQASIVTMQLLCIEIQSEGRRTHM